MTTTCVVRGKGAAPFRDKGRHPQPVMTARRRGSTKGDDMSEWVNLPSGKFINLSCYRAAVYHEQVAYVGQKDFHRSLELMTGDGYREIVLDDDADALLQYLKDHSGSAILF